MPTVAAVCGEFHPMPRAIASNRKYVDAAIPYDANRAPPDAAGCPAQADPLAGAPALPCSQTVATRGVVGCLFGPAS